MTRGVTAMSWVAVALTVLAGAGCRATPTRSVPTPRPQLTATLQLAGSPTPHPAATATRSKAVPTPDEDATARPMNELIETAKADLGQRLGIPTEQISVAQATAVQWPDSSVGCPQPGMAYAQVITPGYLIVLSVGGQSYDYHSDGRRVFLCEKK